ncbi:hypothetical protein NDU88_004252 [Pleurodeles waltl]|uniref:Uncharacterized protein n=1 Tax=Pleurodeles waltl TaxID=8319 RepID=A0AAV7MDJ6_PLEWA|nr:hypothetical protein NDU88_004252 [Pleurodeles waltl]
MEMEAKVLEAVALLRQAGRMDLLKEGALAPARPARRASAGVAAAACSPPRVVAADKVRGASWGAGAKGGPGAGKGRSTGQGRVGNPRGFPGSQDALGGVRAGIQLANGGRCRMCQRAAGIQRRTSWGARGERRQKRC